MSIISPINQKFIRVNSERASSYDNVNLTTSFDYSFEPIYCPEDYTIALRLESFFCPYSFYGINEYNSYLDVYELNTVTNIGRNRTVQIQFGNYAIRDYAIQLATQLNALGDIVYTFIINKNQTTFSVSVNNNWNATLLFATGVNKARSCHNQLGFRDNIDYAMVGNAIHSNKVAVMYDIIALSLKLDLVNNIVVSNENVDNILTTIPVNNVPFGIISYQNADDSRRYLLSQKYINMFKVVLVDNNNNVLNLNGKHFFFTLQIDFIPSARYGLPVQSDARAMINRLQYPVASYMMADPKRKLPNMTDVLNDEKINKIVAESIAEEL